MTDDNMRVSQQERERVVDILRTHAGEGRLEVDELEQRVEAALAARTHGDLAQLTADLPKPRSRRTPGRRAMALASPVAALLPLVAGIAILVAAPAELAWVGWTALGWWCFAGPGLGFAGCGHAKSRRNRQTAAV